MRRKLGTDWEQKWEHWEHLLLPPAISPFQPGTVSLPVALPAEEAQAAGGAVLVRLRPESLGFLKASFEDFSHGHVRAIIGPSADHFFPRVPFVALGLFVRCHLDQFRGIEPPDTAGVKPGFRFRPQLVAVAGQ